MTTPGIVSPNMGSDNLENGTSPNDNSAQISSPVVQAIASHVGRYYPVAPKAATNTGDEPINNDKTYVERSSSVNNSAEIIFHGMEAHAPVGFDNPFFKKEAGV